MKTSDTYPPPSEPVAPLPTTVTEIGQIHFEGNIIPHPWYQRITLESGKPDLPAIIILAEIVYWYRPYQTLDKRGKPLLRKHFDGDMFQCSAAYFETKFGLTKTQARRAIARFRGGRVYQARVSGCGHPGNLAKQHHVYRTGAARDNGDHASLNHGRRNGVGGE
jgi:hypothetical protein